MKNCLLGGLEDDEPSWHVMFNPADLQFQFSKLLT